MFQSFNCQQQQQPITNNNNNDNDNDNDSNNNKTSNDDSTWNVLPTRIQIKILNLRCDRIGILRLVCLDWRKIIDKMHGCCDAYGDIKFIWCAPHVPYESQTLMMWLCRFAGYRQTNIDRRIALKWQLPPTSELDLLLIGTGNDDGDDYDKSNTIKTTTTTTTMMPFDLSVVKRAVKYQRTDLLDWFVNRIQTTENQYKIPQQSLSTNASGHQCHQGQLDGVDINSNAVGATDSSITSTTISNTPYIELITQNGTIPIQERNLSFYYQQQSNATSYQNENYYKTTTWKRSFVNTIIDVCCKKSTTLLIIHWLLKNVNTLIEFMGEPLFNTDDDDNNDNSSYSPFESSAAVQMKPECQRLCKLFTMTQNKNVSFHVHDTETLMWILKNLDFKSMKITLDHNNYSTDSNNNNDDGSSSIKRKQSVLQCIQLTRTMIGLIEEECKNNNNNSHHHHHIKCDQQQKSLTDNDNDNNDCGNPSVFIPHNSSSPSSLSPTIHDHQCFKKNCKSTRCKSLLNVFGQLCWEMILLEPKNSSYWLDEFLQSDDSLKHNHRFFIYKCNNNNADLFRLYVDRFPINKDDYNLKLELSCRSIKMRMADVTAFLDDQDLMVYSLSFGSSIDYETVYYPMTECWLNVWKERKWCGRYYNYETILDTLILQITGRHKYKIKNPTSKTQLKSMKSLSEEDTTTNSYRDYYAYLDKLQRKQQQQQQTRDNKNINFNGNQTHWSDDYDDDIHSLKWFLSNTNDNQTTPITLCGGTDYHPIYNERLVEWIYDNAVHWIGPRTRYINEFNYANIKRVMDAYYMLLLNRTRRLLQRLNQQQQVNAHNKNDICNNTDTNHNSNNNNNNSNKNDDVLDRIVIRRVTQSSLPPSLMQYSSLVLPSQYIFRDQNKICIATTHGSSSNAAHNVDRSTVLHLLLYQAFVPFSKNSRNELYRCLNCSECQSLRDDTLSLSSSSDESQNPATVDNKETNSTITKQPLLCKSCKKIIKNVIMTDITSRANPDDPSHRWVLSTADKTFPFKDDEKNSGKYFNDDPDSGRIADVKHPSMIAYNQMYAQLPTYYKNHYDEQMYGGYLDSTWGIPGCDHRFFDYLHNNNHPFHFIYDMVKERAWKYCKTALDVETLLKYNYPRTRISSTQRICNILIKNNRLDLVERYLHADNHPLRVATRRIEPWEDMLGWAWYHPFCKIIEHVMKNFETCYLMRCIQVGLFDVEYILDGMNWCLLTPQCINAMWHAQSLRSEGAKRLSSRIGKCFAVMVRIMICPHARV